MRIPDQIKIGGFTYYVDKVDGSFISNGAALDGEHSFSEKKIKVSTNGCGEYQDLVFLHEVCHAIIAYYMPTNEQDEEFVEQFSKGLYQVLMDNPNLLKDGEDNDR